MGLLTHFSTDTHKQTHTHLPQKVPTYNLETSIEKCIIALSVRRVLWSQVNEFWPGNPTLPLKVCQVSWWKLERGGKTPINSIPTVLFSLPPGYQNAPIWGHFFDLESILDQVLHLGGCLLTENKNSLASLSDKSNWI